LELLPDSKTNESRKGVLNPYYAKFRCDKARVVDIVNFNNGITLDKDTSFYSCYFVYRKGEIVSTYYDLNLDNVCSCGIHYFKTRDAAISFWYRQKERHPMDGVYIDYYESGQKHQEIMYKQGLRDGLCIVWHENDREMFEGKYNDRQRDGIRTW
jgi:antitoxin component YwqK of YwqJK toxin-antitoxin module